MNASRRAEIIPLKVIKPNLSQSPAAISLDACNQLLFVVHAFGILLNLSHKIIIGPQGCNNVVKPNGFFRRIFGLSVTDF